MPSCNELNKIPIDMRIFNLSREKAGEKGAIAW